MIFSKIFNPYWVVGFTDGEGTFHVGVQKNQTMALGYQDFCRVHAMIKQKLHLTPEGLEEINIIRSKMNRGRFPEDDQS